MNAIRLAYEKAVIDVSNPVGGMNMLATPDGVALTFQTQDGHRITAIIPPEVGSGFAASFLELNGVVKFAREQEAEKAKGLITPVASPVRQ